MLALDPSCEEDLAVTTGRVPPRGGDPSTFLPPCPLPPLRALAKLSCVQASPGL